MLMHPFATWHFGHKLLYAHTMLAVSASWSAYSRRGRVRTWPHALTTGSWRRPNRTDTMRRTCRLPKCVGVCPCTRQTSHPAFMPRAQQKRKHQNPLLEAQLMAAKLCNHLQGMTESRFYDSTLDF